ncbi:mitochondrial ribosomal subunit protein-domain-containing protein [Myxozyma melibiosi]|uniref:Mitochondrial ribosomal subunit protein-domain-containing protein n=1 Tax=Myxozyma melibiosi TaxID=54550 RepID=A0ABR1F5U7_9ASCO
MLRLLIRRQLALPARALQQQRSRALLPITATTPGRYFSSTRPARDEEEEGDDEDDSGGLELPENYHEIKARYRGSFPSMRDAEYSDVAAEIAVYDDAMRKRAEKTGQDPGGDDEDFIYYDPSPEEAVGPNRNSFTIKMPRDEELETPTDVMADDLRQQMELETAQENEEFWPVERPQDGDELPSEVHRRVEQHREKREYNRVAAWEMPLLSKEAIPFVAPTNKEVFKFRYTTYMGQEHAGEAKVTVEFEMKAVAKLYFGEGKERAKRVHKMSLLCGPRYNPTSGIVHMSSERFPNAVQNKKFLADSLKKLLVEAYDIETEAFEDIPRDTRHVKPKKKVPMFPKEWERPQDALDVY